MTKFKLPKPRFDRKIANDGREIYVTDENGTYWGTFRIALVDQTLPRYRLALERLSRKYQPTGPKGKRADLNETIAAELFVELALLDWTDVADWNPDAKEGATVPFSKAKAVEFFSLCETDEETGEPYYPVAWLLARLSREAEDLTNFQPLDQTEPPEKN